MWISTIEKLPDRDQIVLIASRESAEYSVTLWIGYYNGKHWRCDDTGIVIEGDIYWMPIPELPPPKNKNRKPAKSKPQKP